MMEAADRLVPWCSDPGIADDMCDGPGGGPYLFGDELFINEVNQRRRWMDLGIDCRRPRNGGGG